MYKYDRQFPGLRYQSEQQPIILRPSQRYSYYSDRPRLAGPDDPPAKRKGTQVLYVRPTAPAPKTYRKIEYRWSFDTADGRREYETALNKHLKDKGIVSNATYEPLSGSADIAKLASNKFAELVLIVHSAADGPAIGVDLSGGGDWIKDDEFAKAIAPFGYSKITILGCDSVSNKFTPRLAKNLPKGSTVVGHSGGDFEITRHFDYNTRVPGHLKLTRVKSNLKLKSFKTQG